MSYVVLVAFVELISAFLDMIKYIIVFKEDP